MTDEPENRLGLSDLGPWMFHPAHERNPAAWWPANEAAEVISYLSHIGEDLVRLSRLRERAEDPYDQRLLLKHFCIELVSLFPHVDRLRTIVMTADVGEVGERAWLGVTPEQLRRAKSLFRGYQKQRSKVEREIRAIRNQIGAHRDHIPWDRNMHLWDQLEPSLLLPLYELIRAAVNHAKDMDLYQWSANPSSDRIRVTSAEIAWGL